MIKPTLPSLAFFGGILGLGGWLHLLGVSDAADAAGVDTGGYAITVGLQMLFGLIGVAALSLMAARAGWYRRDRRSAGLFVTLSLLTLVVVIAIWPPAGALLGLAVIVGAVAYGLWFLAVRLQPAHSPVTSPTETATPAGWYAVDGERQWWNGAQWVPSVAHAPIHPGGNEHDNAM